MSWGNEEVSGILTIQYASFWVVSHRCLGGDKTTSKIFFLITKKSFN